MLHCHFSPCDPCADIIFNSLFLSLSLSLYYVELKTGQRSTSPTRATNEICETTGVSAAQWKKPVRVGRTDARPRKSARREEMRSNEVTPFGEVTGS